MSGIIGLYNGIKKIEFDAKISKMIFELSKKRILLEFEDPVPIPSNLAISTIAPYPKKAKIKIEVIKK